ncbi:prestin-like isoform X2 [Dreissena polymorpha]|nr:prestin-like isoform X2 [Dreissena polymorpha]
MENRAFENDNGEGLGETKRDDELTVESEVQGQNVFGDSEPKNDVIGDNVELVESENVDDGFQDDKSIVDNHRKISPVESVASSLSDTDSGHETTGENYVKTGENYVKTGENYVKTPKRVKKVNASCADKIAECENSASHVNHIAPDAVILDVAILKPKAQAQDEVYQLIRADNLDRNGNPKLHVQRPVFNQHNLDENYEPSKKPAVKVKEALRKKVSKCVCSLGCFKGFLLNLFPFFPIMKSYNIRTDLPGDIVSGLTVGVMHIPQGMAYGMLTTLPPVYGLYMSFFPVLLYCFLGSSKHVSMGTFAVATLMIGSTVSKGFSLVSQDSSIPILTPNDTDKNTTNPLANTDEMSDEELDIRLQFAMSVSLVAGVIQLLMGIFRLGFVTVYLSDSLIAGFTTGAACHVFTSQIKHIFAIKTARYNGALKLVYTYIDFFSKIAQTNYVTVLMSLVCIAILYSVSTYINQNPKLKAKMFMPVPIELIVVVLATVISYFIKLETKYSVPVVSDIPTGLPMPNLKNFSRIPDVISDAIALSIVIFAISISMGKLLAQKHDYEVNADQELVAYGISTIISSFLSSAAPSASLSRSLVQERVGGKTQVAGLISCALLLVVILAIGPYFRTLPNCVLASVIIVALRGMFLQALELPKLWKVSIIDFAVWIVAFLTTVLLDVDLGLGCAVIFNILTIVCRSQRPYATLLGQIPGTDIYRDIRVFKKAKEVPGLKIFRFEHSLFFVNIEHFRSLLYKKIVNPRTLKITQKKRASKIAKANKEAELSKPQTQIVLSENLPDMPVPMDSLDMELHTSSNQISVNMVSKSVRECPPDLDFHTIILDASPWSFIDSMGVKVLVAVIGEFKAVGVKVMLASCKAGIRKMFKKTDFYKTLDNTKIFVSVHDAVLRAQFGDEPPPIQNGLTLDHEDANDEDDDSDTDSQIDIHYADDDVGSRKLVVGSNL